MATALERVFLASPTTGAANPILAAPWVFTGEDNLRVVILNSQPGVVVALDGRFVEEKAPTTTLPLTQTFVPTANRLPTTFDFPIGVGFLLNVSVVVTSGSPLVGQTYVMVQVIRGLGGATLVLGCLLGGYITAMQHLAYPGSPIQSSTDGEPFVRVVSGAAPAAGAEFLETVPVGARWELLSLLTQFQCSGAAGARVPSLRVSPAGTLVFQMPASVALAAFAFEQYVWSAGSPGAPVASGNQNANPLFARAILPAGSTFGSGTLGLDAGDQYTAPQYLVREWLEGA